MNNRYVTIIDFLLHKVSNSTLISKLSALSPRYRKSEEWHTVSSKLSNITLPCKTLLLLVNHSCPSKGMAMGTWGHSSTVTVGSGSSVVHWVLQPGLTSASSNKHWTIGVRFGSRTSAYLSLESRLSSRLDSGLTQYLFYQYLFVPILNH